MNFWEQLAGLDGPVVRRVRSLAARKNISLCGAGLMILLLGVWASVCGCPSIQQHEQEQELAALRPGAGGLSGEQLWVRVRLADNANQCSVAVDGPFGVLGDRGQTLLESRSPLPECAVAFDASGSGCWTVGAHRFAGRKLEICPRRAGTLRLNQRQYNGFLRLLACGQRQLTAINVVHIEDYVAGVVTAEMPANYAPEALKAQAVCARTYVMFEKYLHRGDEADVYDDTNSQVYTGLAADRGIGRQVTDATRGLMMVYGPAGREQIFATFFSSTCGGGTVSVKYVKPKITEIPPLAGGVGCNWCGAGKYRNWGPVRVAKSDVWAGLRRANSSLPADGLARGARISEGNKDRFGRLLDIRVSCDGWTLPMRADELRMAVGPSVMKSTLVSLSDTGDSLVLSNGHGWGHGMGLCQVGAGGLATAGYQAGQILLYYYPGATIKKAY